MFSNVYYMDIFDLWEYLGGEDWRNDLLPYLQGKENEVDKFILDYQKYQSYSKYYKSTGENL